MTEIELLCAARGYLDLTFTGLRRLPTPGSEVFAEGFVRSPGGGALNAIGAARLGLVTAGAFALGCDEAGSFVRTWLEGEGIMLLGESRGRTPVTVVLPIAGDRAFVTYDPETALDPRSISSLTPERVIYTLDQIDEIPATARSFVTVGDREASRYAGRPLPDIAPGATVLLNEREAEMVTGRAKIEDAVRHLGQWAEVVVVTRGASGALAYSGGTLVHAPGTDVCATDPTGAGDLFAAAWIWGEARGLDLETRLRWAVLYASLSVTVPTAAAGAADLATLLGEGRRLGLPEPSSAHAAGMYS